MRMWPCRRAAAINCIAKIRAMVQARVVEGDLVDAEGQMLLHAAADNMVEPADYSVIQRADLLPSAGTSEASARLRLLPWLERAEAPGRPPAAQMSSCRTCAREERWLALLLRVIVFPSRSEYA